MADPFTELLLDWLACYVQPLDSRHWEMLLRRADRDIRHDFLFKLIGNHPEVTYKPAPASIEYSMKREFADARLRNLEPKRVELLLGFFPIFSWGMRPSDWQARARLAAFAGLRDALRDTREHLHHASMDELFFAPFEPETFAHLPEPTRHYLLHYALQRCTWDFWPLPAGLELMEPKRLDDLMVQSEYFLALGGPQAVARLMGAFPDVDIPQHHWAEVFADPEKAIPLLDAGLKTHRKRMGGRPFFYDLNGPLYALCLLRSNQLDKLKKLSFKDNRYPFVMEALKWPSLVGEEEGRALVHEQVGLRLHTGLTALFVGLALFWSLPDELPAHYEDLADERDAAREAGLDWAAEQFDQLLERSQGRSGPHALVDWNQARAPWQRALEELASLAEKPARTSEEATTLAWEYTPVTHKLTPREQKRSGGSKSISLKKLRDSAPSYLLDQDHRILKHLEATSGRSVALGERAWVELIGHPNVLFCGVSPMTVERGEFMVDVQQREDGWQLSLKPEIPPGRKVVLVDKDGHLLVYEKTAQVERLLAVLGSGLSVPEVGTAQLQDALASVSTQVEVRGWQGLGAEKIKSDSEPRLQIRPSGPGLRVDMRVRPLGNETSFAPGEGPTRVGNAQVETVRNLEEERARAEALRPRMRLVEPVAEWSWRTHWLEDSLELLESLKDCPLEWPEGTSLKLRTPREALRLQVASEQDWFMIEGELELDDQRKLTLQKLLELVANNRGRFVTLGEGEYLALTDDLRRQLEDLRAVSDGKKGRVHPLAAQALQDLPGDADWERHKARIAQARAVEPKLPRTFQAELRPYQEDGARWMLRLAALGAGACLADDMGLGKTVQTLAVLLARSAGGPALVVAPTSVCPNWIDEAARFAPTLVLHQLPAKGRAAFLSKLGPRDVLVASYGLLEELGKRTWHTVVLDEAQAIKNASTQRSKAAQKLESDFRVITTGTPVENHLGELWNLFTFLNPGLLGSHQSFQARFGADDPAARHRLKRLVGPFLLRRTKSQVLTELPPRTDITLHVELPPEERTLYEGLRKDALERLDEKSDPITVLAGLTRLRRACCHPELVAPGCGLPGAKLQAFLELVEELRDNRHRALVFSQFVDVLQIARKALDQAGVSYQYLDGSTPIAERKARVDAFQAGEGDLFLISLKAGGFGLNLTAADYVIHLDPWWNPAVEDQASDRAHRIGQERPVTVYRMVARDTVEEKIVALHAHKRELAENLLEDGAQAAGLSTRELITLLGS